MYHSPRLTVPRWLIACSTRDKQQPSGLERLQVACKILPGDKAIARDLDATLVGVANADNHVESTLLFGELGQLSAQIAHVGRLSHFDGGSTAEHTYLCYQVSFVDETEAIGLKPLRVELEDEQ